MDGAEHTTSAAVLVSGGVDSAVLTLELCRAHRSVFPLFVRGGLHWEEAEQAHLERFLRACARRALEPLTLLEQPVHDVYGSHWSTTGRGAPGADSPDHAVYLPGRNLFLISKAAVWCVLRGIRVLALGSLQANPFPDSTPEFDREFESLLERALGSALQIRRPYTGLTKLDVLRRGAELPLELTFSCIAPVRGRHCGLCNKCAERRRAFSQAGIADRTVYAVQ
jgi:7-cyano-7-deazaguanine synthase